MITVKKKLRPVNVMIITMVIPPVACGYNDRARYFPSGTTYEHSEYIATT